MGVFGAITPAAESVIEALLGTSALTTTVTYRLYGGEAFNASLGHSEVTYTEYTGVTAAVSVHDERSAGLLGSDVSAGDRLFLVRATDVPVDSMSLRDELVTADGTRGQIKAIEKILDSGVVLTAEQN